MVSGIGIVLAWVGALYGLLAISLGNCTAGSLDGLAFGAFISLFFYGCGLPLIISQPPKSVGWFFLLPVAVLVAYQLFWSLEFSYAYWISGLSVCAWREGISEYPFDGREQYQTILWVGTNALCIAGIGYALDRRLAGRT